MVYLSPATPERFSALAPEPLLDLERLRHNLDRGTVRPEHLLVASDGDADIARVGLFTHGDGTSVAYAFVVPAGHPDLGQLYRALLDGVARAAASTGIGSVTVVVVDDDEPAPRAKRAALLAVGWHLDDDRLELEAAPAVHERPPGVAPIDPAAPEVVAVMAAAMAESLDGYDREQVGARGARDAAAAYRDMMAGDGPSVPWLAHHGNDGVDGIAAVTVYPTDWNLGYLGVAPWARRSGVGATLARSVLGAAAAAGAPLVTASVAVANVPIRRTLEGVGFTVRSARSDYVLRIGAEA